MAASTEEAAEEAFAGMTSKVTDGEDTTIEGEMAEDEASDLETDTEMTITEGMTEADQEAVTQDHLREGTALKAVR